MKKVISTENIPIKLWLDDIEDGALAQAKNLANLPFAFRHIAIMADSHQGYGMPIGGVLATEGVVIPNAVGVDIGAVDKDTEILTQKGWVTIDTYKNEDVLVWDDFNKNTFFSKPFLYIVKPCEDFTEYKNKYGLDQVLSDEHRMLVYEGYGKNKKSNTYFCKNFKEKLLKLKKQDYYSVRTTFKTTEVGINLTDERLALRIMISADGYIRKIKDNNTFVELHFKKQRKIDRSKSLLKKANVDFKEYKNNDGSISINFTLDWVCNKDLTDLFLCSQQQAKIIFDEYLHWDGSIDKKRNHKNYTSTHKLNADVIQYICALNGVRAGINKQTSKNKNWNDWYNVYQTSNPYVGFNRPKKIKVKNGKKYCFMVETGYFVARRNGKIFVTGNCGMCAVKTSLKEIDTDTLKKIMGEIRKAVPVGFEHHEEGQDIKLSLPWISRGGYVGKPHPIVEFESSKMFEQVGTLGGGNHFIEIQKGSDGYIWIMIHSGSRNLGFKVANHYNKLANKLNKMWHTSVPKERELAFLPINSDEGKEYIREMNYCVEFALANRKLMMDRIKEIFVKKFKNMVMKTRSVGFSTNIQDNMGIKFDEIINIAHNYASMENHFGKNVMVHRKGATLAREDTIGIIPGSQGTKSYIVQGKGNKDSFESCSHGAGRMMSRTKAKKELSLEDEVAKMDKLGVIHGMRNVGDLDEAPGAYKDISVVMKNQEDLVDVLVELTPLAVIKG